MDPLDIGTLNLENFMLNEINTPNFMIIMFISIRLIVKLTLKAFNCGVSLIKMVKQSMR